jgi:hypothetical protein
MLPPRRTTTDQRRGRVREMPSVRARGELAGASASMSEIAFHEKAGWSQGNSGFIVSFCSFSQRRVFLRRVATVAMLPSALSRSDSFARCTLGVLVSAGAAICLAPCGSALGEWNLGQAINAVTGTRRLGFLASPSQECFDFMLPPASLPGGYCAAVRTLLRLPTSDAVTPPTFWRWQ